ncbi:autophagy protein Apg5-domain-containing protein [Sordaria brevicollis]|uniref:Autophagy protein 5 n=1 Tax=Sordaria brevicollis TaxID=83679 RepID=A0AAE0UGA5_SORBR|nr:autophagy protein Apg5-domain-containing protein [Sordaria brevicollis]
MASPNPNPYSHSPQLPQREESPYSEDQYQSSPSVRSTSAFRSSRGHGAGTGTGFGLGLGVRDTGFTPSNLRGGGGGSSDYRSGGGDSSHDDLPPSSSLTRSPVPPPKPKPKPTSIPETLWSLQIPLYITHQSHPKTPYICSVPRFSYLALLLPQLSAYYGTPCSSFHHEEVLLRNLAVGLLVDLYQPAEMPWRLVVSDGEGWDICDTFMNSAKEADFIRNGNAKRIMGLSKEHTTALWNAVQDNDYQSFTRINTHLLNAPTALKNVPIRIYIPSSPPSSTNSPQAEAGSYRVLQTLVPPRGANGRQSLKTLLPALFPSSRDPVLANVILHGAPVPFSAPLEELMKDAAYPDGWLCLIVVLL